MGIQINGNNDIISALDGSWTAEGAYLNTTGIATATTFKGNVTGTACTFVDGNFTGNVTIGGTLTYEDVTNIDSVGIVTARDGIFVPDDKQIKLGNSAASPDFKIYHDSSSGQSLIEESGPSVLKIKASDFRVSNTANSKDYIQANDGAAVKLFYNGGAAKFETTNTGVTVTGTVVADDLVVTGTSVVADLKSTNNNYVLGIAGNNASDKAYVGTDSSGNFLLATGSGVEERLRIKSDGDVLIGGHTQTANDPSKLSVYNSGSNIGIIQVHCGTEAVGDLAGITFGQGGSNTTARPKTAIAAVGSGSYGRSDLCFYVDGTADNNPVSTADEKLRITSTGKIGIATDNPATDVHIQGTAPVLTLRANNASSGLRVNILGQTGGSNGQLFRVQRDNTTKLQLNDDGDLVITGDDNAELKLKCGTSTGNNIIAFLNSSGTTKGNIFYDSDNNFMVFKTNGTAAANERLRIDSDGNLTAVNTTSGATTGVTLKVGASAASGTNSGTVIINNGGLGNASLQFDYEGSAARAKIYTYRSTNDIIFDTSGTEKYRFKDTGEFHISDRNSANTGEHIFQAGAFGIRMQDTGGYNRWNIERSYGGFQSTPLVHFSAQGRVGINQASPGSALNVKAIGSDSDGLQVTSSSHSSYVWQIQNNNNLFNGSLAGELGIRGSSGISFSANAGTSAHLRITSGGQVKQYTTHTSGNSAHANTSWYADDANEYTIEIRDFNEMYATKTANSNSYNSIIYKREKMTHNCDIEFMLAGGSDVSSSSYYHLGMAICGDGSDTSSNWDRFVFRCDGNTPTNNQIRVDKAGGGSGFSYVTSSIPQFFDGNDRHIQIKIRGRRYSVYSDGVEITTQYSNADNPRQNGFFGFIIYEASSSNPWLKIRDFKIQNYSLNTSLPSWDVVKNTPASTNNSYVYEVTNLNNPRTVEVRFWRLRHSGGDGFNYMQLGAGGSYQTSGYYDIGSYHNETSSFSHVNSRGHNQSHWCPFNWSFNASTNYFSGVITIRRITSPGRYTRFIYNSEIVVDYDGNSTQYYIDQSGQVSFGGTLSWERLKFWNGSSNAYNYGEIEILAQH